MSTTTVRSSTSFATAVELTTQARDLVGLLQVAYDAIAAAEGFARHTLLAEAAHYSDESDGELGHAYSVLRNEFRSVDKEDFLGPLRAAEDLATVMKAREEDAEKALDRTS